MAETGFGGWVQGVGFLDDARTVFAQGATKRSVYAFRLDGETLAAQPRLSFKTGSPVAQGLSGR